MGTELFGALTGVDGGVTAGADGWVGSELLLACGGSDGRGTDVGAP